MEVEVEVEEIEEEVEVETAMTMTISRRMVGGKCSDEHAEREGGRWGCL